MFIDFWVVALFSALFGFCAIWNHKRGFNEGIRVTLTILSEDKVIMLKDDKVVPYTSKLDTTT